MMSGLASVIEQLPWADRTGIREDGQRKILAGVTSVEEVLRVTLSG